MKGECLCRKVQLEVGTPPEFINACNCKLCRRSGASWGYYMPSDVLVNGETSTYRRDDLGREPGAELHFCPTCGSVTHFVVIDPHQQGTGVNMRLFGQDELEGIEVRYYDTRSRLKATDAVEQTGTGCIGDGRSF